MRRCREAEPVHKGGPQGSPKRVADRDRRGNLPGGQVENAGLRESNRHAPSTICPLMSENTAHFSQGVLGDTHHRGASPDTEQGRVQGTQI